MPTVKTTATPILAQKSDCLILLAQTVKKSGKASALLSPAAEAADADLGGQIAALCAAGDFTGKGGQVAWLDAQGLKTHKRALIAGLGEAGDAEEARDGLDAAFAAAAERGAKTAALAGEHLSADLNAHTALAAGAAAYNYRMGDKLPATGKDDKLREVFLPPAPGLSPAHLAQANATADGMALTKHLGEQPGNVCTPSFLGEVAKELHKKTTLSATVMSEAEIRKRKMGGLLAVSQGSAQPPRFIVLRHEGGGKSAPVALVGKGVTFDTGGISIKPALNMDEMKFDMCGAATVFGVMLAVARAKLPLNVTGIVPTCENMPSANALKPGDVITAASGKTIEVLNTDAEGRLILADALHYADSLKPAAVIDIATLTGACVIALGAHVSGLMGRGDELPNALLAAGEAAGDPCCRMPLGKKYQDMLKSDYADMANIGGRPAGAITAGCFLSRFVECEQWAHLDIAGTAWNAKKRATGRPVPLLMRYLQQRAAADGGNSGGAAAAAGRKRRARGEAPQSL